MTSENPQVWGEEDDWFGVLSQSERRKRQNRVHQRAYRQKRHQKRLAELSDTSSNSNQLTSVAPPPPPPTQALTIPLPPRRLTRTTTNLTPATTILPLPLPPYYILRCPSKRQQALRFLHKALQDFSLGRPVPRDLPRVSRLNALEALCRNAFILGIPADLLESEDGSSLFFHSSSSSSSHRPLPIHLRPTELQRTVPHHPWLDIFPFPVLRDNVLVGLRDGLLDEDEVSGAMLCDLIDVDGGGEGEENEEEEIRENKGKEEAYFVIWGDSWDLEGWEFSSRFLDKWGDLLRGCRPEVLRATNRWRERRREWPL